MPKIKVIIKRPDEKFGHVTWISPSLKNLQKIVDGPIQIVKLGVYGTILICNEEGKLQRLERNFKMGITFPDIVVGEVIIAGTNGEDLADVPISFDQWKALLKTWNN